MQVTSRHSLPPPCGGAAAVRQMVPRAKYDKNRSGDKKASIAGAASVAKSGTGAGVATFIPNVIACNENATLPPSRHGAGLPGTRAA